MVRPFWRSSAAHERSRRSHWMRLHSCCVRADGVLHRHAHVATSRATCTAGAPRVAAHFRFAHFRSSTRLASPRCTALRCRRLFDCGAGWLAAASAGWRVATAPANNQRNGSAAPQRATRQMQRVNGLDGARDGRRGSRRKRKEETGRSATRRKNIKSMEQT